LHGSKFRIDVPEGRLKIARRFQCPVVVKSRISPEGTAEKRQASSLLNRPFGTFHFGHTNPALKRRAIFKRPPGLKNECNNLSCALRFPLAR
jgi:hypothetical protein